MRSSARTKGDLVNLSNRLDTAAVVVVGKESVGKSALVGALTGSHPVTANVRGTTISCETYKGEDRAFVDTPGILRESDSLTTRMALARLGESDHILVVVNGTHLDEDLAELVPLARGKRGTVVVTFWDKVRQRPDATETLARLEAAVGVPMIPVDARRLSAEDRETILQTVAEPREFPAALPSTQAGWTIEPRRGPFELPRLGRLLALALLFVPPWIAVSYANRLADTLYDPLEALLGPALDAARAWPAPLSSILAGNYGLLSMGPFLLLYAIPTVALFALILALFKTSGLIDRLSVALDPWLRPFGLSGRDLVRVIMGFGCNVPAVINSRACSSCSRGTCVSAISFGAACSYQMPATLAVFAAAGKGSLAYVYVGLLATTTLIYLRLLVGPTAARPANRLKLVGRDFLHWPTPSAVGRDAWFVVRQFLFLALPVFFLICVGASLLQWAGAFTLLTRALAPVMTLFNLPPEAALAVILGSIRKDGIAIGLLGSGQHTLKVPLATSTQLVTAVYLAGVLMPCLVTLITVTREMSPRFALRMVGRQIAAAAIFSLVIAWGGALIF